VAETAKKKHPEKWARAKAKARKKMGGHSARAMQLATKYYKTMGGKYEGKKSSKNKLGQQSKLPWLHDRSPHSLHPTPPTDRYKDRWYDHYGHAKTE